MVRPKSNTPEGIEATKRWRETMAEKYGKDWHDMMVEIGRKGGKKTGVKKGFALDRNRARSAGAKGGAISSRQVSDKPSLESRRAKYYEAHK